MSGLLIVLSIYQERLRGDAYCLNVCSEGVGGRRAIGILDITKEETTTTALKKRVKGHFYLFCLGLYTSFSKEKVTEFLKRLPQRK
jgi:hypothetical protein